MQKELRKKLGIEYVPIEVAKQALLKQVASKIQPEKIDTPKERKNGVKNGARNRAKTRKTTRRKQS